MSLDAVAYRFTFMRKLLKPSNKPLIEDGEVNKHLLRQEFLTHPKLEAQLRLQGIENIREVRCAYMEPNGMINAFREDGQQPGPTPAPPQSS